MPGPESGHNLLAAPGAFFWPNLGQRLQELLQAGVIHPALGGAQWFALPGRPIHIFSSLDAANFSPN